MCVQRQRLVETSKTEIQHSSVYIYTVCGVYTYIVHRTYIHVYFSNILSSNSETVRYTSTYELDTQSVTKTGEIKQNILRGRSFKSYTLYNTKHNVKAFRIIIFYHKIQS